MENSDLAQFEGHKYLNLETFRRSGVGVKTPVWFVEQDGVLYVRTINDSGKVKRIRNNGQVRIVPCKSQGEPVGEWIGAHAELVNSSETEQVTRLLKRKYGLMKSMFDLLGRPSKAEPATIAIRF